MSRLDDSFSTLKIGSSEEDEQKRKHYYAKYTQQLDRSVDPTHYTIFSTATVKQIAKTRGVTFREDENKKDIWARIVQLSASGDKSAVNPEQPKKRSKSQSPKPAAPRKSRSRSGDSDSDDDDDEDDDDSEDSEDFEEDLESTSSSEAEVEDDDSASESDEDEEDDDEEEEPDEKDLEFLAREDEEKLPDASWWASVKDEEFEATQKKFDHVAKKHQMQSAREKILRYHKDMVNPKKTKFDPSDYGDYYEVMQDDKPELYEKYFALVKAKTKEIPEPMVEAMIPYFMR